MSTVTVYVNVSNSTIILIAHSNRSISNNIDLDSNGNSISPLIFVQFLYLLMLLVVTIIGNTLVLYLIGKHLKCTSFTNTFISSLSLSDLTGLLICVPLSLTTIVNQSWIMGNVTCVLNSSMNNVFSIASTYMLMCIVIDRYLVIAKIPRSDKTTKIAHGAIVLSWTLAVVLSIPWYAVGNNMSSDKLYKPGHIHCCYVFHLAYSNEGTLHSIIIIIIGYMLPVIVMISCCGRIWNVIHRTDTEVQPASVAPVLLRLAGELKTAKTVLIMVLVYVLTKMPYVTIGVFYNILNTEMTPGVDTAMLFLFWTTGAIIPLIYANRNDHFSEFLHLRRQTRTPSFTNLAQSPRVPRAIQENAHEISTRERQSKTSVLETSKKLPRLRSTDLFNVMSCAQGARQKVQTSKSVPSYSIDTSHLDLSRNNSFPYVVACNSSRKGSDLSTVTTATSVTLV